MREPSTKDYGRLLGEVVHDCDSQARCALEIDDSGRVKIGNIVELIRECRYGIRDISRTRLRARSAANELPCFDMPPELGLFLGATRFGGPEQQGKRSLILDREPYRYRKFVSDIAG